jgi:hypothetical protein
MRQRQTPGDSDKPSAINTSRSSSSTFCRFLTDPRSCSTTACCRALTHNSRMSRECSPTPWRTRWARPLQGIHEEGRHEGRGARSEGARATHDSDEGREAEAIDGQPARSRRPRRARQNPAQRGSAAQFRAADRLSTRPPRVDHRSHRPARLWRGRRALKCAFHPS